MTYVALAYGFIWVAVFGYIILVARRVAQLHAEVEDLHQRLKPTR